MIETASLAQIRPHDLKIGFKRPLVDWRSTLNDDHAYASETLLDDEWKRVRVPHNWEDYHGYHAVSHGNLHGTAWYRTWFEEAAVEGKRLYAFFEGVGSYATVFLNGTEVGKHAGGRTTFTVDLTECLKGGFNVLAVKVEHPEKIDDLPFVCGGCWGAPNTEGSQPFGIFRPVWLESTGPVRVVPFGVHVLTPVLSEKLARVETRTTLSNPGTATQHIRIHQEIRDESNNTVSQAQTSLSLDAESETQVDLAFPEWKNPQLWSPSTPAMHRVTTEVLIDGELSHQTETDFGLRWVQWPVIDAPDADHNVVSADRRGRMITNGVKERTLENNGLTEIQQTAPDALVALAPMGACVYQGLASSPHEANLRVAFKLRTTREDEQAVTVFCEIQNEGGTVFFHQYRATLQLLDAERSCEWIVPTIHHPHLWNDDDPYLHRLLIELRSEDGQLWERSETLFGIRGPDWDSTQPLNLSRPVYEMPVEHDLKSNAQEGQRVLKVNGEPVFLNGTCEYETLLGCDHAFTDEQIAADVSMMCSAGFNAFRDAHHPHNLRYYHHWDRAGMLCWTQIGSHIWFDNERFRSNYRQLVREWVIERRNHPSIIIWGLQNESVLPEEFATELRDIIRELDPTSPNWRITTTCNGGKGSDWNVPQEWSGTYGGNCNDYNLKACQMVGEYGAWRNFGVHTECEYAGDENDRSETWACAAMEAKIRRGEEVRDRAIGHFHWIFNSFPNPGRSANNFEGPGNSAIGSINNKGLVTAWHQPSDLYYLYRANYTDPQQDPMVYIVSHTWPDRWHVSTPRRVSVFSNCEEVELFNGVDIRSYGKLKNPGRGEHFTWENIEPQSNLLYAVAYHQGKRVAEDLIRLDSLPEDSSLSQWIGNGIEDESNFDEALFRVNCGSPKTIQDFQGQVWAPDTPWAAKARYGWESWGNAYDNVPDDLASSGFTMTPVRGTHLQKLYRTYRYGREYLKYHFRTGPGRFRVRCHFTEPWFGVGGSCDAKGWRMFDVAINNTVVEHDLDIWSRCGNHHRALIRTYDVDVHSSTLTLSFPTVTINQALICGIEVLGI